MKLLVIRMSSLGDVLLSTSFLESLPDSVQVDWIISSDFAFVLQGHPKIRSLIIFDKKAKLKGWLSLLRHTLMSDYDARVDLHVTLRSKIARWYFFFQDFKKMSWAPWVSISKERLSFLAAITLKGITPAFLQPTPFWKRFSRLAQKFSTLSELKPPSYEPLLKDFQGREEVVLKLNHLTSKQYLAVMPASRWKSKEWSTEHYVSVVERFYRKYKLPVLLLGRKNDAACAFLENALQDKKIPYFEALQESDFKVTAILLKHAIAYLGGDTGLAHLAEAVGTPSLVIYGPTRPLLGFGPWRNQSSAIFSDVFCSPCSKDGKVCYRVTDPYACLKRVTVDQVFRHVEAVIPK